MATYRTKKGFVKRGRTEKTGRQVFLTRVQIKQVLQQVEEQAKPKWHRDHALIYLGYYLGLRVGEACILERATFRNIDDHEANIRTLKNLPRLPVNCKDCGRRWRVSMLRVGQEVACPRCQRVSKVPGTHQAMSRNPPEKKPPVVESAVCQYIRRYMDEFMRPDQRWFFEGTEGSHLSTRSAQRVFSHYVMAAGLDPQYSFHSLRHGRGLLIWERFKDPVMVRDMLRQKSLGAAEFYMHLSPERLAEYERILSAEEDDE